MSFRILGSKFTLVLKSTLESLSKAEAIHQGATKLRNIIPAILNAISSFSYLFLAVATLPTVNPPSVSAILLTVDIFAKTEAAPLNEMFSPPFGICFVSDSLSF